MIVILGIIALIITPVITGVIQKQEKKTFEESIHGILKSIEIDTANDSFKTPREYKYENGKLYLVKVGNIEKNEIIKTNGKYNGTGSFIVNNDGIAIIKNACNEKYCASSNGENSNIAIENKDLKKEDFKDKIDDIINKIEEDKKKEETEGPIDYTVENGVIKKPDGTEIGNTGNPDDNGTIHVDENGDITINICNKEYCGTKKPDKPNVDVEEKDPKKDEFEDKIGDIVNKIEDDEPKGPTDYTVEDGVIKDPDGNEIGNTGDEDDNGNIHVDENGDITVDICNKEYCGTGNGSGPVIKPSDGDNTKEDPIITLKGNTSITLSIGSTFTDPGAVAKTRDGTTLAYQTEIKKGSSVVTSIDTSIVSTYTIYYKAVNNNKTVSVSRTVKIVDGIGPVITFDRDTVELESEEVDNYNVFTGVTVTDNMDGTIDISKVKVEGSLEKIPGTYNITYKVKDSSGNETKKTRTFIVKDLTKPTIILEPSEQNKFVKEQSIKIKATDNIQVKEVSYVVIKDGVRGESKTGETVILNETGNYEIEVTAIDSSNNTSTLTSSTYKIDRESPTITFENTTIKVTEVGSYDLKTGVSASDNSGIEPTLSYSGGLDALKGTYTVTYTATDEAGNSVTKDRVITVVEAEGPILNFSDIGGDTWRKATTVTVYATDNSNLYNFEWTVCDSNNDCKGMGMDFEKTPTHSSSKTITLDQDGIYTITINAKDQYGNTSNMTSSTYKIDTTPPTAGTATFTGTLGSNDWYTSDVTVNIENGSDALSGHSSTTSNASSITSNTSGTKITITTTDNAGNSATREYTVKVDKTAPTLTLKSTGSATITEGDNVTVSTYYNSPKYSISSGSMSCSPTNTSGLAVGTRTVSCTATGGNGLTKTVNKTVVVNPKAVSIATKVNESSETMTNDPDRNRRYVGSNPSNYVRFNNELWRIIGIFGGQAKIIRNDFYSTGIQWDKNSSNGGHGSSGYNDWSTATLQAELNGTYLNGIEETSRGMIDESHVWKLGGTPNNSAEMTRAKMYGYERGTTVYSGRPTTWIGAIGLIYASDYGYSTSATDAECESTTMNGWNGSGNVANCKNNSWLTNSSNLQWTLSPSGSNEFDVFLVDTAGRVDYYTARNSRGVRPVLYLKSGVQITTGTGSSTDPFELSCTGVCLVDLPPE